MSRIILFLFFVACLESYGQTEEADAPIFMLPYDFVDKKPMFEQCKDSLPERQELCFKQQLDRHIAKNFRYPMAALEMGIQGKVRVFFRINTDGTVSVLQVRGVDKLLEAEVKRVIAKLPPFIPAQHLGKPMAVNYKYYVKFEIGH